MRLVKLILFAFSCVMAQGGTVPSLSMNKCWDVMKQHGLTDRFPGAVSHAIHSLTLQDLRHYFDKKTKEKNGVPVVNLDLNATEHVLLHSPNVGYDERFLTMGLRAADQVLANMDNPGYDIAQYTILERLIHALHMQEVWEMTSQHYNMLIKTPPKNKEACQCVKDVNNNGILKFLHYMALKIRYPQMMYKKSLKMSKSNARTLLATKQLEESIQDDPELEEDPTKNGFHNPKTENKGLTQYGSTEDQTQYGFHYPKAEKKDSTQYGFDFPKPKEDQTQYGFHYPKAENNDSTQYGSDFPKPTEGNDEAGGVYDWDGNLYTYNFAKESAQGEELSKRTLPIEPWQIKDEGVKHISDSKSWANWKNMMLDMDEHDHYEAGFFLYCMLNE